MSVLENFERALDAWGGGRGSEGVEEAGRALVAAIREAAVIEPCHTTGMHDPNHTTRGVCDLQRAALALRVLDALGLDPEELPRRLHDEEACGWCHRIPSQEEYRQRLRELWRWAGLPISAELAAPAADCPAPGDPEIVLSVLRERADGEGRTPWDRELGELAFGSWSNPRLGIALAALQERGVLEISHPPGGSGKLRLVEPEPTGGPVSDEELAIEQVAPRPISDRPQA